MTWIRRNFLRTVRVRRCGCPRRTASRDEQVYIKKVGNAVMLIPFDDPWQLMLDSLDEFTDDFMLERNQPTEVEVRESFD